MSLRHSFEQSQGVSSAGLIQGSPRGAMRTKRKGVHHVGPRCVCRAAGAGDDNARKALEYR